MVGVKVLFEYNGVECCYVSDKKFDVACSGIGGGGGGGGGVGRGVTKKYFGKQANQIVALGRHAEGCVDVLTC